MVLVSLLLLSRLFIAENYFQLRFPSLTTRFTVADSTETVLTLIISNLLCFFSHLLSRCVSINTYNKFIIMWK